MRRNLVSRPLLGYAFAVAMATIAFGVRFALDPILGGHMPMVTLFGAAAVATWLAGYRAGIVAAALGYLACEYWIVDPVRAFGLTEPVHVVGLLAYILSTAVIIACVEAMCSARRRERQTSARLQATLTSIGDGVITTDPKGIITAMNAVAEQLTGWTEADARGRSLTDVFRIVNEFTRATVPSPVERALAEGVIVGLANHTLLIRRDGDEGPIEDSAAPIRDADGEITGCVLVFRDATDRRRLEQALADELEAALRLAAIVESSNDAIVGKALDGTIQSWNRAAERLFGYPAAEAIGKNIRILIPPDRADEEESILARLRRGERVDHFETIRVRRDGSPVEVSVAISPIVDDTGRVMGASKIARDITEQRAWESRVRELMEEAREANRRKDEFLAMLAHELRGPLAPLRNSLEILKRAGIDGATATGARETSDRQVRHMERLVDDLLDISRITRAKLELRIETIDLRDILRQAVESNRSVFTQLGHELAIAIPGDRALRMRGDSVRLTQLFGNVLNNAAKYTEPPGRIELDVAPHDDSVDVAIRDNGIGIAEEMLPRIFELFVQADRGLERASGGLGIGLTLVRQLTEMHGGTVRAESPGVDQGTTITVTLPLLSIDDGDSPAPPLAGEPRNVTPRRILVVDDNPDSAESLAMLLDLEGHTTWRGHDGLEAVALAEQVEPEVILLDIGLPRLNGYDACRRIREGRNGGAILMIALTGWGQEDDRRASREAGFDAHLVKPVDYEALAELLERHGRTEGRG